MLDSELFFKKILFLTDGSAPSLSAQELTINLAKKMKSEVTVFHVVTHDLMRPIVQDFLIQNRGIPESADSEAGLIMASEVSLGRKTPTSAGSHYGERVQGEITSIYRQEGEDIVADSARMFKEEGVPAEPQVVVHKNIVKAVMEETKRKNYDLIVIGRSGHKESESRLGTLTEKVSRRSEIPVLIAGERKTTVRLLVPLDGSKSSEKALVYASSLAKKIDGKLTLLHVQESRLFSSRPKLTEAIGKNILSDAGGKLQGISFDQRMEAGDPARKITDMAEKENFDLIVLGNSGHSSLGRSSLGGVTSHVLHYTRQSVLIVK
jgi:nucleotide-binding universal stress UspA family protein